MRQNFYVTMWLAGKLLRSGVSAERRKPLRQNPHPEFRMGNGLFSCIHFGMDDCGKRRLNSRCKAKP
jgi:hypothetical protein